MPWSPSPGQLPRPAGVGLASFALALLPLAGCSSGPVQTKAAPAEERLRAIGVAYGRASDALKRPPRGAEELRRFLPDVPGADPAAALVSPNDQKPFVVVAGVNLREPGPPDAVNVLAYEHTGSGGSRYVVDSRLSVRRFSESEFGALRFPADHKKP